MEQSLYSDTLYKKFLDEVSKIDGIKEIIPNTFTISEAREHIKKTGEPLFQELRDRYMKLDLPTLKYEPACFAAGTLVHTKEGLKPIETIQVGDWVLSKHESGKGEREYKRVTQTFKHEDREVRLITIGGQQEDGTDRYYDFVVTPEHPIWVQGKGWKPAEKLKWSFPLWSVELLIDDRPHVVNDPLRLIVTDQPDVAWRPLTALASDLQYAGTLFNVHTLEKVGGGPVNIDYISKTKRVKPEHLFRTTVYNIEVEDFHTYYVGKAGMWVHNKNLKTRSGTRTITPADGKPKVIYPDPGGY